MKSGVTIEDKIIGKILMAVSLLFPVEEVVFGVSTMRTKYITGRELMEEVQAMDSHGKRWMVCLSGYLQVLRVRFGEQTNTGMSGKEQGLLSLILLALDGS